MFPGSPPLSAVAVVGVGLTDFSGFESSGKVFFFRP